METSNSLKNVGTTAPTFNRYMTHEVKNQAKPAVGFNAFDQDVVIKGVIKREVQWAEGRCSALGQLVGDEDVQELARQANTYLPELKTHDKYGNRIDWVDFHPSWHKLMALAWEHEVPNLSWRSKEKQPHLARAALSYLWNQVEHGTCCPTGQTYASYAGFMSEPALKIWAEKALGAAYEFSRSEVSQKPGIVIGYAMTEKQGGSDLRETQTVARFSHSEDYHGETAHWYELTGHKWFCSVPQSDGFFTLAKVNGGVTCFFLPRTLPDGNYNKFFIQRLKDKCGNKSNASSEIEYCGTMAIRVGQEGRGIREILSHSHLTRLDFAVGSAGLMRQSLTLAINHAYTRSGFNDRLAKQPMMANVLADLAIESESATLMAMRIAKATDHLTDSEHERAFARVATPMAKFFNCSRVTPFTYEALQCHGGNGFIEENPMARIYRESPLNSIWEGTANMMCMDVRRALTKDPSCYEALKAEFNTLKGMDRHFDAYISALDPLIQQMLDDEFLARAASEAIARAIQGAELLKHSSDDVIEAFMSTRLGGLTNHWGVMFGTMGVTIEKTKADRIVERAQVTR
jgi:putative acyl-CoA dehydrogenase